MHATGLEKFEHLAIHVQVSVKSRDKVEDNYPEEERDVQANVDSRDNRELVDNNTAQRLTGEDIEAMRRSVREDFGD